MSGIQVAVSVPQFEKSCSIAHINNGDASYFDTFSEYSFDVPRAVRDASWLRIICSKEEFCGLSFVGGRAKGKLRGSIN